MKKFLSIALAATMLISSSAMVFAADKTSSTLVKYGVGDQFEVSIPAEIDLDTNGYGEADLVVGDNFLIPAGTQLEVYISGHDYTTAWELIDTADATNKLTYTINDTVVNNDKVLTLAAGHDVVANPVKETLKFQVTSKLAKSGNYNDTLTFRITVAEATISFYLGHQEVVFNENGEPDGSENVYILYEAKEGMTWGEWIESDYSDGCQCWIYEMEGEHIIWGPSGVVTTESNTSQSVYAEDVIIGNEHYVSQ